MVERTDVLLGSICPDGQYILTTKIQENGGFPPGPQHHVKLIMRGLAGKLR